MINYIVCRNVQVSPDIASFYLLSKNLGSIKHRKTLIRPPRHHTPPTPQPITEINPPPKPNLIYLNEKKFIRELQGKYIHMALEMFGVSKNICHHFC